MICIVNASSRKNGFCKKGTDMIIDCFKKENPLIDVKVFDTINMDIKYCTACAYCEKNKGECIIQDDMKKLLCALKECTQLLIVTPVYFSSVPASLKAAIDRCQCMYVYNESYIKKKAYILAFGGSKLYNNQFEGIFASFTHVFKDLNASLTDSLCIPDTDSMNETIDNILSQEIEDFAKNIYNNL